MHTPPRLGAISLVAIGAMTMTMSMSSTSALAAPVHGVGHVDLSWTVTDASGGAPPDAFGAGGPWGGPDRTWSQPGFVGSYLIEFDGRTVPAYCADFHNASHPDASSTWVSDEAAFVGSDTALAKLSYAQWRWGDSLDPDTAAALGLYTHFLGSPGDRSNRSGVPVPDIDDDDLLDEIVTVGAPHGVIGSIMVTMDAASDAWAAAFDFRSAGISGGVKVSGTPDLPTVASAVTGRELPSGTYDLAIDGDDLTVTTAGLAIALRDITSASQNTVTAGVPQRTEFHVHAAPVVTSQVSDPSPRSGTVISDAITIAGLGAGTSATVRVELFDLTVDPTAASTPLANETRNGIVDGTTLGLAPFTITATVAGHTIGYRHRLVETSVGAVPPTWPSASWSELGIVSETAVVDVLDADVHLRTTVRSTSRPDWVNAQSGTVPSHEIARAPDDPDAGSHDDGPPDRGDGRPIVVAGDAVSFAYHLWLDATSTGAVTWEGAPVGVIVDDDGTGRQLEDDFRPVFVGGDDGDGFLEIGEVWRYTALEHRIASAGEDHTNFATVRAGAVVDPITQTPTGSLTTERRDPAGYVVPCVDTSAADPIDGDQFLGPDGGSIIDLVSYCHLVPGETYSLDGVVVDRISGVETAVRGATTFTPTASDGTVEVRFDVVDITAGDHVVVETLRRGDRADGLVAVHADLDDAEQTFTVRRTLTSSTDVCQAEVVTTSPETSAEICDRLVVTGDPLDAVEVTLTPFPVVDDQRVCSSPGPSSSTRLVLGDDGTAEWTSPLVSVPIGTWEFVESVQVTDPADGRSAGRDCATSPREAAETVTVGAPPAEPAPPTTATPPSPPSPPPSRSMTPSLPRTGADGTLLLRRWGSMVLLAGVAIVVVTGWNLRPDDRRGTTATNGSVQGQSESGGGTSSQIR